MFKWLRWLIGGSDDKKVEPVMEDVKKEGFVDPETGKVYKTAGSLKAAQTRRKNKRTKKTKKSKK